MVHVKDQRLVGQWIQFDLWGIYQQLTSQTPRRRQQEQLALGWAQSAR
jgi:hypothetical protein